MADSPPTSTPSPGTDKTNPVRPPSTTQSLPPTVLYPPVPPPQPEAPRGGCGGCGCWLAGITAIVLAAVLVGVGLFLPPVNLYDRLFGTKYTPLDAVNNAVASSDGGVTLVLSPADVGREFGVAVNTVSLQDFQSASAQTAEWLPTTKAAVPPYLTPQSAVYDFQTEGTTPNAVNFDFKLPQGITSTEGLDVYGYDIETGQWRFLPAQPNAAGSLTVSAAQFPDRIALFKTSATSPAIIVTVDITQALTDEVAGVASIVAPAGMTPTLDGKLVGSLAPGFNVNSPYRVMPVVRNFIDPRALDPETITAIIGNRALRNTHIQELAAFAGSNGFAGVFIDYRALPADQRENFSTFIRDLKTAFRASGLLVGVIVPPAANVSSTWETGAYDWRILGDSADFMVVDFALDPLTFLPGTDRLVEAMLRWGVGEVSRYKLVAAINALSVRDIGGEFVPVSYGEALAPLGSVTITAERYADVLIQPGTEIVASLDGLDAVPGLDTQLRMPFVEYLNTDGTKASTVWLMTGDALRSRLELLDRFGLGGAAFTDLTAEGIAGDVIASIANYTLQLPGDSQSGELALRWRIEGANGAVSEVVTNLNQDLLVTLEAPEGNYAINVDVVGGGDVVPRSGAAVALFNPTPTLTPPPTATQTLTPTPTNTLAPIVPTQPAASGGGSAPITGGGGPAIPPGPGSIAVGNFEYGGHVTSSNSERAVNAMQQAGMNWMKIQVRYGNDLGTVQGEINGAHGRGFKILVSIVGTPADLLAGGASYISQYAGYTGSVASLGPDAIEVWNEPNIRREWPEGTITGANYTNMLGQAYTAIKGANPNVLVISAALAPTGAGFDAQYAGKVVNDDEFLRQMVAAGAMNYLDCVGIHYNEGIVPPDSLSGDGRDDYYTRYFQGMLNTYWAITGGAKPLCFTELGYLTPEGYGSLPVDFSWAQNTTIAQHAAWLARAIALASQSGKVKLLIVWNVDFGNYNYDPQAGYAMIRADGSCPACAAIEAAR